MRSSERRPMAGAPCCVRLEKPNPIDLTPLVPAHSTKRGSHGSVLSTQSSALRKETRMAGKCDVCGKIPSFGHNVSHSKRRTNRMFRPNVQRKQVLIGGVPTRVDI